MLLKQKKRTKRIRAFNRLFQLTDLNLGYSGSSRPPSIQ